MESLDYLSDSEIRAKLAEYGHPVGPVTETTRNILLKKLKILTKYKSPAKNHNRSLAQFSSGDDSENEQNGGRASRRRVSMPPPTSFKATRRKSQRVTPEVLPVPSNYSSESRTGLTPNLLSTSLGRQRRTPRATPTSFDSGSDSEAGDFNRTLNNSALSNLSFNNRSSQRLNYYGKGKKTAPTYGTLASYRSRLLNTSVGSESHKPSDDEDSYSNRETRSFISQSQGETDDLNNTSYPLGFSAANKYRRRFQYPVAAPSRLANVYNIMCSYLEVVRHHVAVHLSMIFVILFAVFFLWLSVAYYNKVSQPLGLTGFSKKSTAGNVYPLCTDEEKVNCINKTDLQLAVQLYKEVHQALNARAVAALCGPLLEDGSYPRPYMTERELLQLLLKTVPELNPLQLESSLQNLKLLLLANPHWGVRLVLRGEKELEACDIPAERLATAGDLGRGQELLLIAPCPQISLTCRISRFLYKLLYVVAFLALGGGCVYLGVRVVQYRLHARAEEHKQVMELVDKILHFVSAKSEFARITKLMTPAGVGDGGVEMIHEFCALRHVHDSLLPLDQRQTLRHVWDKAVKFIEENESRVRTEVQQLYGETTTVWRWLGPPLVQQQFSAAPSSSTSPSSAHAPPSTQPETSLYPDLSAMRAESNRGRVWQGEAFETGEGSVNCLPVSPTECLKIRHMFQQNKDYGADWVTHVTDAIVEKCEGAKILHLQVDKDSKEGCVYVKCASQQDAGLAYRQLHGSWFDGALVTVRYLRLERYHDRFPESLHATTPLRPSNNLRLSLKGMTAH